jgi:hypothetical protein
VRCCRVHDVAACGHGFKAGNRETRLPSPNAPRRRRVGQGRHPAPRPRVGWCDHRGAPPRGPVGCRGAARERAWRLRPPTPPRSALADQRGGAQRAATPRLPADSRRQPVARLRRRRRLALPPADPGRERRRRPRQPTPAARALIAEAGALRRPCAVSTSRRAFAPRSWRAAPRMRAPGGPTCSSAPCRPHTPWSARWRGRAFVAIVPTRPCPLWGRPVPRRGSPPR